MSAEHRFRGAAAWVVALCLSVPLLALPILAMADEWRSPAVVPQRWGTRGLSAVWNDPLIPRALGNSIAIAGVAVAISVPAAWLACRALSNYALSQRARTRILVFLLLPLLLPPLAVGEGLRHAFLSARMGFSLVGIALSHLVYVIPYTVILLLPAFTDGLRELEEAASGLGSRTPHRFWMVTLPAVAPNLLLAAAMGFVVSWSQYGTTLGVGAGIPTLPIVLLPFIRNDPQVSAVLSLILVAPAIVAIALSVRRPRR